MKLNKRKLKLFDYTTLFLLINCPFIIRCLIEFPISVINIKNNTKYKGIELDTEIPPNLEKIINENEVNNNISDVKVFSETGDFKLISALLFSIKVELGSPKQIFNLVLDTGSSITWVPLKNSFDLYPIERHYDPTNSTTSKKLSESFEIVYGSGSCKGTYFSDQMVYLNDKKFELIFGAAYQTDFGVNEVDGIIGLSKIYNDNSKSFIHMLCKSRATDSKIFSFKLGLNTTSGYIGKFYIGKHDDFKKDNVVTCEMKNNNYFERNLWACEMSSFSIVSNHFNMTLTSKKKVSVIFDSGTNVIFLPLYYLEEIVGDLEKMNCYTKRYSVKGFLSRYQLICLDYVPDFHLVIGGHTFVLPAQYFFYFNKKVGFSKIMFQESLDYDNDAFIIGSPFFMLFHILFDSYSKELHFYPEKNEFLIKGNWWTTSNHILVIIILVILVIILAVLIILFVLWKKRNKLDKENKENFDINSYLGLL